MLQWTPLAQKHTLSTHSSQLVFHISAHTYTSTHIIPSESTAHRRSCMQTHEHTPSNTAETALWGYHNTVSAMLLSLSLSPCHLSFNILHLLHCLFTTPVAFIASFYIYFFIASTLQSCVSSYNADFLRPSVSLLCFPYSPSTFLSLFTRRVKAELWSCSLFHLGSSEMRVHWYSCGVFTFGSISVVFLIRYHWSETNFLRCLRLLCASRAAAQRCSAASTYKD